MIRRLENQLDKEIVKYNETVAENKKYRDAIDKHRKDRKAAEEVYLKILKQKQLIELFTMKTTKKKNRERTEIDNATMSTILIKNTYAKKKFEYGISISRLREDLKSKVDKQKEDERKKSKEDERADKEQANPVDVMKMRLENWTSKVIHKRDRKRTRLISSYSGESRMPSIA